MHIKNGERPGRAETRTGASEAVRRAEPHQGTAYDLAAQGVVNDVEAAKLECVPAFCDPAMRARLEALGVGYPQMLGDPYFDSIGCQFRDTIDFDAVVDFPDRRFEFARYLDSPQSARVALIVAARNEFGEAIDLAAIDPDRDGVGLWRGRGDILGAEIFGRARLSGPPIAFGSPLAWLRRRREGIFVIDGQRARLSLEMARPIVAENERVFRHLERETKAPPIFHLRRRDARRAAA